MAQSRSSQRSDPSKELERLFAENAALKAELDDFKQQQKLDTHDLAILRVEVDRLQEQNIKLLADQQTLLRRISMMTPVNIATASGMRVPTPPRPGDSRRGLSPPPSSMMLPHYSPPRDPRDFRGMLRPPSPRSAAMLMQMPRSPPRLMRGDPRIPSPPRLPPTRYSPARRPPSPRRWTPPRPERGTSSADHGARRHSPPSERNKDGGHDPRGARSADSDRPPPDPRDAYRDPPSDRNRDRDRERDRDRDRDASRGDRDKEKGERRPDAPAAKISYYTKAASQRTRSPSPRRDRRSLSPRSRASPSRRRSASPPRTKSSRRSSSPRVLSNRRSSPAAASSRRSPSRRSPSRRSPSRRSPDPRRDTSDARAKESRDADDRRRSGDDRHARHDEPRRADDGDRRRADEDRRDRHDSAARSSGGRDGPPHPPQTKVDATASLVKVANEESGAASRTVAIPTTPPRAAAVKSSPPIVSPVSGAKATIPSDLEWPRLRALIKATLQMVHKADSEFIFISQMGPLLRDFPLPNTMRSLTNWVKRAEDYGLLATETSESIEPNFLVGLTSKGLRYLTIDPSTSVKSATTANSGNSASSASSAPAVSAAEPSPPRERRNRDFSPSPPPVHISSVHYTAACIMDTLPDGTKLRQAIEDLKSGKTTPRDFAPLRAFRRSETWWTVDNQRLYTYKESGVRTVRVTSIAPPRDAIISMAGLVDNGRKVEVSER